MNRRELLKGIDYYFITDSAFTTDGVIHDVGEALRAGVRIIQYREKYASTRTMIENASELQALCRGRALLIINDRVDVALAVDADGVHLGDDDMSYDQARALLGDDSIIGVSIDNDWEGVEAQLAGADYVGLGPVYGSTTKVDAGDACGVDEIERTRHHVGIPIAAIGGITRGNAAPVIHAGASAVCSIGDIYAADDLYSAIVEMRTIVENARAERG